MQYLFFFLFAILGPTLPIKLEQHSMVQIMGDLYVLGGYGSTQFLVSIYKLSCSSGECAWTIIKQELKIGRLDFVAIPVMDSIVNCSDLKDK